MIPIVSKNTTPISEFTTNGELTSAKAATESNIKLKNIITSIILVYKFIIYFCHTCKQSRSYINGQQGDGRGSKLNRT